MTETSLESCQKEINEDMTNTLNIYRQVLRECGDNPGPVFYKIGKLLFFQGLYAEALEAFIKCHQVRYCAEEIENIIIEAYYQPNIDEFKTRYEANVDRLSNYQYIFARDYPDFSELQYCFIPYSDSKFAVFDKKTREFRADYDLKQVKNYEKFKPGDLMLIKNEFNVNNILVLEHKTRDAKPFLWMKIPFYLYYENFDEFVQYLQVYDFTKLLGMERLVFLFGVNEIDNWFSEPQSVIPKHLLNMQDRNESLFIHLSKYNKNENYRKELQDEVNSYYDKISKDGIQYNIKSGKPRILFITSRFTTAVQYFIRDCALACDKLGIPNRLLIEKSNVHRKSAYVWLLAIREFKPDIIFIIDHFRWEYPWVPENVVFLNWVQDALPHIMSPESTRKIKEMDFILNMFITGREFFSLGYPAEKLIDAVVPVNPYIYKTFALTEQEKEELGSDICVFSNAGNPQKGFREFLNKITGLTHYDTLEKVFKSVYEDTYRMTFEEQPLYTIRHYEKLILKWCKRFGLSVKQEALHELAERFRQDVGYRIMRSVPLEWLHEKGYNMKLWGREWVEHPVLNKYAQGVAQNGEVLSKVINASKIVIGTNPGITTHPRVFETILSNSFYLGVNIPETYDWANIRKVMEEGKEIVFFYNREDLYKKVDFYLENEQKRKEIIEHGKKKVLANLTYESMMTRVIKELGERLAGQIGREGKSVEEAFSEGGSSNVTL